MTDAAKILVPPFRVSARKWQGSPGYAHRVVNREDDPISPEFETKVEADAYLAELNAALGQSSVDVRVIAEKICRNKGIQRHLSGAITAETTEDALAHEDIARNEVERVLALFPKLAIDIEALAGEQLGCLRSQDCILNDYLEDDLLAVFTTVLRRHLTDDSKTREALVALRTRVETLKAEGPLGATAYGILSHDIDQALDPAGKGGKRTTCRNCGNDLNEHDECERCLRAEDDYMAEMADRHVEEGSDG